MMVKDRQQLTVVVEPVTVEHVMETFLKAWIVVKATSLIEEEEEEPENEMVD